VKLLAVALVLVATACNGSNSTSKEKGDILVFAAASLTESFASIGNAFEAAHPGVHVRFNFGPSDGLANGIKEIGGADVFASASPAAMDLVEQDPGVVARRVFVRNRLALIVPRADPAKIGALRDLSRAGVKLAIAARGVPAGMYARRVLAGAGLTEVLGAVSNEIDVKSVVQKVVLGEADAGIVYVTDVTPVVSRSVTTIQIPDAVNVIASYPIAVLVGSKHAETAREFVDLVLGAGQSILRRAGFLSP
jgi:molybdate transport system substrate-binding protein